MSAGERRVAAVSGLTALAWVSRPALAGLFPDLALSDAGIAVAGAMALFVLPSGDGKNSRLLDWETAAGLRWDVLILFGGGLALAAAIDDTGLAAWIGARAEALAGFPVIAILAILAAIIVYLGELASNTAMAAIFLPVAGAMALAMGADPLAFALPVAMAASIGFMLPVATPPNAIVFSNPAVTRADMIRAGAWLDIIGIAVALAAGSLLGPLVFG
jgi:sodium-dependent dicarboxylate transporter 2/3/5